MDRTLLRPHSGHGRRGLLALVVAVDLAALAVNEPSGEGRPSVDVELDGETVTATPEFAPTVILAGQVPAVSDGAVIDGDPWWCRVAMPRGQKFIDHQPSMAGKDCSAQLDCGIDAHTTLSGRCVRGEP